MTNVGARRLAQAACVMVFSGYATSAQAQDPGFAINRFDPSERGSDWFALESLDLRGHGRFAVGLVGDWAYKPLVAYDERGKEIGALVENQVYGHLGASAVFWDRVRFGVSLPVLLYQNGEDIEMNGDVYEAPTLAAAGDLRLGSDVRLFGTYGDPATLALGVHVHLPTGSEGQYSGDGNVRIVPRLSLAGDIEAFTYAFKTAINTRLRSEDFAGNAVGTEWTFGAAAGARLIDKRLTVGPELWFSTVIVDGSSGFFKEASTPFEGLFGAHFQATDAWKLGAGVGPGFTEGLGSPQLRTVISIEWFPQPEAAPQSVPPPSDRDGDGIIDAKDACPNEPGIEQEEPSKNGCPMPPDRDGDGIIDAEDACPGEAGVANADPSKHGCAPPRDADADGIIDEEDACPAEAGEAHDDPKKNGCPKRDADQDGILDENDACPNQAGPANDDPKKHGCPQVRIDKGQIKILQRIEFEFSKAAIQPESEGILKAVLGVLNEHPEITTVKIEGHTDNRGSAWLNKKLSGQRAAAVEKWLVEHGVEPGRLSSSGFGSERPVDSNDTEEGRQNNRRVEFHIEEKQHAKDAGEQE